LTAFLSTDLRILRKYNGSLQSHRDFADVAQLLR